MLIEFSTETRAAVLEMLDGQILVIRFKPGMPMDLQGVTEVIERRKSISAGKRIATITVLPEDLDADVDVFVTDHAEQVKDLTLAEVCVSANVHHRRLAELYYSNFPQPFATGVFGSEKEAISWLHSIMEPVLG